MYLCSLNYRIFGKKLNNIFHKNVKKLTQETKKLKNQIFVLIKKKLYKLFHFIKFKAMIFEGFTYVDIVSKLLQL